MDDGKRGTSGLEEHLSSPTLTACPACHLSHHGEGVLIGTEVGLVEHGVGREDAHDGDTSEVETFGDHLGADEEVGLATGELGDDAFVGVTGAGGVEVHTGDACLGEGGRDDVLYFLCACPTVVEVDVATLRTGGGHTHGVATIVATEGVGGFMVSERNVAMGATGTPATLVALDDGGEASTVEEEDGLLATFEGGAYGLDELGREESAHYLTTAQVVGIDDMDKGQLEVAIALL